MTRMVDRLASALDHRLSRRGFFQKTALVGTALAVAPVEYALTPVGAYQAICACGGTGCPCGSMCCDGYTEFCCTMTGLNRCPPNHLLGGWWKVDNSGFCNNGPRYYMDCNAPCNGCGCGANGICSGSCSGTACGCALGNCNNRRAGCVGFRYGQCNNQVACLGPIVCRVVTCVPPWTLDATCTRTVAVDEFTRFHTAPCLHRPFGGLDWILPSARGFRLVGWAVDPDVSDSLTLHIYVNGQVAAWVNANGVRPDIAAAFPGAGDRHGFDVEIAAPPGPANIVIYAINAGSGSEHPVIARGSISVGRPFGALDIAVAGPGVARLVGWTIDPDRPQGDTQVAVFVDGAFAGTFPTDQRRPDIGQGYQGFGDLHGFDITVPTTPGRHLFEVWSVNDGGASQPVQLASRSLTIETGAPVGSFDWVLRAPGGVRVLGWALDPDRADPVEIHVYVDDVYAGQGIANQSRPDVGQRYPAYGNNYGFDITVPAPIGTRRVTLDAINQGPGAPYSTLGTLTAQVGDRPFGWLDRVSDTGVRSVRVQGWCLDPDTTDPIDVHVYVGNTFAGSGRADRARPDLAWGYPGYGPSHGFDVTVPAVAGNHNVCVYAINVGSGTVSPIIGCAIVRVG